MRVLRVPKVNLRKKYGPAVELSKCFDRIPAETSYAAPIPLYDTERYMLKLAQNGITCAQRTYVKVRRTMKQNRLIGGNIPRIGGN